MKLNITVVSIIRRTANIIGNNNSINTDNPRHVLTGIILYSW